MTIVTPAPLLAARELLQGSVGLKPWLGRVATWQLVLSRTFGLEIAGELLVVMGLWPHEDGSHELFMACAAAERVRPHVLPLIAAGRLILARLRQDASVGRLVARVVASADAQSGRRLARAVGLIPVGAAPPGPFVEMEMPR